MATPITKFVRVSTRLATKVVPAATFGTGLFLGCDPDYLTLGTVPIDRRYLSVTKEDFADYLDSSSEEYAYALAYFSQDYTPDALIIGRVIEADSAPYVIFPNASQDYTDYVSAGASCSIKFTDDADTPNVVQITAIDLDSVTSFAQVVTILNGKLAALVTPAITGLNHATFFVDNLGRLGFQMPDEVGDGSVIITLTAASTGTDLFGASYFDGATQVSTPGYDAEEPVEGLQALQDLSIPFYNIATFAEEGANDWTPAQYLALAQYIETQVLQFDFLTYDADAKNALITTDTVSDIKALSLDRTTCYYTERTTQRPDAANAGYVFPQDAGSCSFAYNALSNVSESGLTRTLTSAEMSALDGKNCLYVCTVGGVTFVFKSLSSSGEEKRLILGIDWFNATCQIDILNDRLAKKTHAYDYDTFSAVEAIIYKNAAIAYTRNIFYSREDKDYPFTVDMPDPTDFSAAEKKTHVFDREVFHGYVKSEILTWAVSGIVEI